MNDLPELLKTCLIVCPLIFCASFVDSVAGGGGLISIPAYLLAGVPTYTALGTNKLVNGLGTGMAAIGYIRSRKVVWRIAAWSAMAALGGSAIGTKLALLIPENILQLVLLAVLPVVAVFLVAKKDFGRSELHKKFSQKQEIMCSVLIGLFIGCYDGMFGPGTGTFLIMLYTAVLGMDLLMASGCAKISNLASNLASAAVYLLHGKVWFALAIPAAVCSIAGGWIGSRFAIRGGSKRVRSMIFVVLCILFVKILYELLI